MLFWVDHGYKIWTLQSLGNQILVHSFFMVRKFNVLDYHQGLMIVVKKWKR
jgi:hypothetical protein